MCLFNTRHTILAIICLSCLWLPVHFKLKYRPQRPVLVSLPAQHNETLLRTPQTVAEIDQKEHFIHAELQSDDYDLSGLADLCASVQWTNKVVFTCDNNAGGIGNVRNHMLNCIRYVIEAGGSLVLPRIILRNTDDIASIYTNNLIDMDYLFDRPHFKQSMNESCPQMHIHDEAPVSDGVTLFPEGLDSVARTGLKHPGDWRRKFDRWLENNPSEVVHLDRSYLTYPIHHDPPAFSNNFGRILRFRSDVRQLASTILYNLHRINLHSSHASDPIISNLYLGVHLRTESDALKVWGSWSYGTFEEQTDAYIQQATQANLSLVYVASGDADEIYRFEDKAPNLTIVTKDSLLEADDRRLLQTLTFDQQALIDFLVLLKSSNFGGVGQSSFSWNIALRRHLLLTVQDHLEGPQMLSDELSTIYGKPRQSPEYEACMWP